MDMFRLGLVVNPLAGLGGPVALKGSDGVAAEALARGAEPRALERTRVALECLLPLVEKIEFLTFPGAMGGELLERMGFRHRLLGEWQGAVSSAADTRLAIERLQEAGVALILFAGGDGTARDVAGVVREQQPVLGIPAGVKIHSGVYAISPRAAGELARRLVEGGLVRLASGEVRDLDEEALRAGRVAARWYGEMTVPEEGHFMQHVKQAGMESEELVLVDLADWLAENWEDGVRYVLGPGSTLHGLARNLGLETTLLGVDVLENGAVIARDVDEARLFELVDGHPAYLLVTAIGGQGHVIGRGNQQISPRVLRAIGLERMRVVATKRKLGTLGGRPLLVDSGDPVLDDSFPDAIRVWAGYKEELLYPLGYAKDQDAPAGAGGKEWTRTYPARCAACCCSPCSDCRWWRPLRSNRSDWWMRRVPRWALPWATTRPTGNWTIRAATCRCRPGSAPTWWSVRCADRGWIYRRRCTRTCVATSRPTRSNGE